MLVVCFSAHRRSKIKWQVIGVSGPLYSWACFLPQKLVLNTAYCSCRESSGEGVGSDLNNFAPPSSCPARCCPLCLMLPPAIPCHSHYFFAWLSIACFSSQNSGEPSPISSHPLSPSWVSFFALNYGLQAKSGLPSVSINKGLLECSHTHSFLYCLAAFML